MRPKIQKNHDFDNDYILTKNVIDEYNHDSNNKYGKSVDKNGALKVFT